MRRGNRIQVNSQRSLNQVCAVTNEIIGSLLTYEMRLNEGVEEAKNKKKKIGVALKFTTNEDSESSEEVNENKEMVMFFRRFKKFMRSNGGRNFQKREVLKLESTN
ncbi:UBN2 domain-containing protein [Gossypium australe]|uniref:UBN2 domain-containing protein n=1 Tax=Gossypium australe TaxID=47621 RepID=A0A5B6WHK9_9ROSI|nr:UBN2 domain-containing protein [Gossypium australe]